MSSGPLAVSSKSDFIGYSFRHTLWLHIAIQDGTFKRIYAVWFE